MFLKRLSLKNYRNHSQTDIDFTADTNILVGNNGEGKTNILEAIYILATGRSHLGSRDNELILWGAPSFSIHGEIGIRDRQVKYDVHYSDEGQKKIRVNKKDVHRLSELIGQFLVVMFSPDSLRIVQGSPQDRRKYIDFAASQSSSQYFYYLQQYYKTLNQRNELLKGKLSETDTCDTLSVWDEQLAEAGSEVIKRRIEYIKDLEEIVAPIHKHTSAQAEDIQLIYQSSLGDVNSLEMNAIRSSFGKALKRNRKIERIRGYTISGPHRDDLRILCNSNDLHKFGSQGQQRTAALSLKLGELDMLFRQTQEKPVLLLDDVMSELDDKRRTLLLERINGTYQTIITTTNLNPFREIDHEKMAVFNVNSGSVERC